MKKIFLFALALSACTRGPTTFTVDNSSGYPNYYGTVDVTGYATITNQTESFCVENCKNYDYVFFNLVNNTNEVLDQYINQENAGNAFMTKNGIGLGCLENGVISYVNASEKGQISVDLSPELSSSITDSTETAPVTLTLTKDAFEPGKGTADCYSHFSEVELSNGQKY